MGEAFTKDELASIGADVLAALGAPKDVAMTVAESLVLSNLMGHDSHGIVRIVQYAGSVRDGQIQPLAVPVVEHSRGATVVVDGGWGFGQPAAQFATALAVERAREHGITAVTIRNCNHIGRVGEYVETLARSGMMGMAWCNSGPAVAPFGGSGRVMGTNPFAWAVPGGEGEGGAVVLDFATSIVAEGKLNIARTDGRLVAPGIILDRDRQPTTDPNDFYAGGSLLPFGAHKGSGMSMLIEMSAALLSGMGASPASNYAGGNGTLLLALEVSWFADPAEFIAEVDDFCREAKTIGAGGSGSDILVPGEKELRTRKEREAGGIEVGDEVRRQITELASGLGVDVGRFELS